MKGIRAHQLILMDSDRPFRCSATTTTPAALGDRCFMCHFLGEDAAPAPSVDPLPRSGHDSGEAQWPQVQAFHVHCCCKARPHREFLPGVEQNRSAFCCEALILLLFTRDEAHDLSFIQAPLISFEKAHAQNSTGLEPGMCKKSGPLFHGSPISKASVEISCTKALGDSVDSKVAPC